ncbi:CocE/NonD family hydrolase [Allosaccharopolyspora coralli]|uniref:CocE/NonD family hydrolase n=1 Tax=Allosaccharopolyspora coralli TaxID=2665642 RepID=A0A5Q3QBF3_9PSEU|nr:CocE/NonD family hydrolase [Allosaccharopolyspora coralli]QGK70696.1 CocE/NonD family hydrolase [Allosaccharopolyspora coralli]
MRTVTTLPLKVREDSHEWVPLTDGARLSATVWRPVSSDDDPVPAILEFIPYRQRDLTARRDSIHHPYMAGHGYACVRVDLRGSGESDGVLTDEYLEQEFSDAQEVLAWLAQQPWCDGTTGMMGISWGGFNALQVAARAPVNLGAVIAVCSSDDRYADDVHYMGGCLLSDNLSWASTMFAYNSCPPDPAVVGERWREMWLDRLQNSGLWLETWLRHQRRDEFWQHGSICEDYSSVQCPVLAVSGWADGYSNAVFRMLEHLDVPRKGLIGPWSHKYPHLGQPGPAVGFLQLAVRWWDRWLKGADNDVMDGPMLCTWMQDSVPPSTSYDERPGRWVGEPRWPSPLVVPTRHPLAHNHILEPGATPPDQSLGVESPLSVGQYAGKWCSYNAPPDLPYDQREEDGGSLTFDTDVLGAPREILGSPVLDLDVEADQPVAMIAARLSDVRPDGAATRVTYGLLNLTHRDGHERPSELEPGARYRIQVALNGVAQTFPAGHRLRVSISTSYWPLAWPPPRPVRLTIHTAGSSLLIPDRPAGQRDEPYVRPFDEPEGAPPLASEQIEPGDQRWTVSRDLVDYESALTVVKDLGVVRMPDTDLDLTRSAWERYSWVGDDFDSVRGENVWTMGFTREGWNARSVTRTILTSDPDNLHLHAQLDAYEGDRRVLSKNWQRTIPRDHV